ncbi:hypothetical protein [Allorhizocola rhizosphaerae]|uniref:hypothetical protein n=1 Tax=Allorhizocola rhizosphaerae TaxID=1872709 RepID=UPI000E3CFE9C|nr:hypothetical protein [Allorhizocola rhizosphaerae]
MPDTGADLGADLYELYRAAKDNLPSVAEEYVSAARAVGNGQSFRPAGAGNAPVQWNTLATFIAQILNDTAKNLDDTALALQMAVNEYAATDAAAKAELDRLIQENGTPG